MGKIEQWINAFGFEEIYEVSDLGRCRKKSINRVMFQGRRRGYAYLRFTIGGQTHYISAHRIIWQSFNRPLADGEQINHIDGVKTNNRLSNLEACSRSQNLLHSYRVLGHKAKNRPMQGIENGKAKLTYDDIEKIFELRKSGLSQQKIADLMSIHQTGVSRVLLKKAYKKEGMDFSTPSLDCRFKS